MADNKLSKKKPVSIAILTIHFGINHGSVLQCQALTEVLQEHGAIVSVIDFVPKRYKIWENIKIKMGKQSFLLKLVYLFASLPIRVPQKALFRSHLKKTLPLTRKYSRSCDIKKNPPLADAYLVGSDQVWNYSYNSEDDTCYVLDFVPSDKPKMSYAASFGKDSLTETERKMFQKALREFAAVSVREFSGLSILHDVGVEGQWNLDPVFLLSRDRWREKARDVSFKERFVLMYIIAPDYEKMIKGARSIADRLGAKLYAIVVKPIRDNAIDREFLFATPDLFLALFDHADYVVSNSFHGTAFSIIFNKQFATYTAKYNSRIASILSLTGLDDRLVGEGEPDCAAWDDAIDYDRVNKIVSAEVFRSNDYLRRCFQIAEGKS